MFAAASGHCLVGLDMHGAFIAHKIQQRMDNRRHGEPERLQTLDILVKQLPPHLPQGNEAKGEVRKEVSELMAAVLGGVESVAREFWRSLRWETEMLLPASVDRFFSTPHKKRITSLSLILCITATTTNSPSSSSTSYSEVEKGIVRAGMWTTQSKFTSVHLACHEGDLDLLQRELAKVMTQPQQGNGVNVINEVDANGVTPLVLACLNGQVEIIKYLIAVGV